MSPKLSLPKDRIRILLLEGISDTAAATLHEAGYRSVTRMAKALDGAVLHDALKGVHLLGIRSRTQMDAAAFAAADRLIAVGCFSVGTNQVDLQAAKDIGVPVFNAPFSNTRSVAELVMGEIVMLMRRIPDKSIGAHAGRWEKSAEGSREVRGKTLGIIGYGNIGTQLSVLAEAFGLRVIFHDVIPKLAHGNASGNTPLPVLLAQSDIVSLHVPETPATEGMMSREMINRMKPGAILINNSRGTVVDLDALADALRDNHLAGAAVDVFPVEPGKPNDVFRSPLQGLPNVILTPHIGGSTMEAQERIGEEVSRKLVDWSDTGTTLGAVNFPEVALPARQIGTRFIHVHRNQPGVLAAVNDVFRNARANVAAQYLQTDPQIGYVVVDAEGIEDAEAMQVALRAVPGTLRSRVLYDRD